MQASWVSSFLPYSSHTSVQNPPIHNFQQAQVKNFLEKPTPISKGKQLRVTLQKKSFGQYLSYSSQKQIRKMYFSHCSAVSVRHIQKLIFYTTSFFCKDRSLFLFHCRSTTSTCEQAADLFSLSDRSRQNAYSATILSYLDLVVNYFTISISTKQQGKSSCHYTSQHYLHVSKF